MNVSAFYVLTSTCLTAVRAMATVGGFGAPVEKFRDRVDKRFVLEKSAGVQVANQCLLMCIANLDCMSFFFNSDKGECQLHGVVFLSPEDGVVQKGGNYYRVFGAECHVDTGSAHNRRLNFCFRADLQRKSFSTGSAHCAKRGEVLAEPDIPAKQEVLQNHMLASSEWGKRNHYLIGAKSTDGGHLWSWSSDTRPAECFWAPIRVSPNPLQQCSALISRFSYLWDDVGCSSTMGHVCQRLLSK